MTVYYLQHVPFEGLGAIADWTRTHGIPVARVALFEDQPLPAARETDALIVMGGPMGANDENRYPWIAAEKRFIAQVIEQGKTVLGICLGAQMIAAVLGARVYPNTHKEIGWFEVTRTNAADHTDLGGRLPERFTAFHWHGDTFDIPGDAVHLAVSQACPHQGFLYDQRVLGLQFHLESTRESIAALLTHCADELAAGPYIQTAETIRAGYKHIEETNSLMRDVLEHLFGQ
jgi:GMP synthase-like glutamine amidotransferase